MKNIVSSKFLTIKLIIFIVIIVGVCSLFAVYSWQQNIFSTRKIYIATRSKTITLKVEIADNPQKHSQGLMNRKTLGENEGMLFIFDKTEELSFWMKDTYLSLDMLFFDDNRNLVNIVENAQPCLNQGNNCPSYYSMGVVKYVLEVNAGWSKLNNVDVDTRLML